MALCVVSLFRLTASTRRDRSLTRSWVGESLAERCIDAIVKAAKVDTRYLPQHHLGCLAQLVLNVALLEKDKPTIADNDFENIGLDSQGQVILHNKRFKTRVRASRQVRTPTLTFLTR